MELRKNLEPDWEIAERLYPKVVALMEEYLRYCEANGDGDFVESKKLGSKLCDVTGRDISSHHSLWGWWEGEGSEVEAFRISLPPPILVPDITYDELTEVVRRIREAVWQDSEDGFRQIFENYISDYYHNLLKLNFKNYKYEYFNRRKGKDGKYSEYSVEEISSKIWGKRM